MMIHILAGAETSRLTLIFIAIINLIVPALFVCGIVWGVRYLKRWHRDGQRLRMEVGKLADEVQQIRKQMENRQLEDSD
jgi:hypothetical protein